MGHGTGGHMSDQVGQVVERIASGVVEVDHSGDSTGFVDEYLAIVEVSV